MPSTRQYLIVSPLLKLEYYFDVVVTEIFKFLTYSGY